MAYRYKNIFNPKTRHEIRFLQTCQDTKGQLLEMEATYHEHSREPAPHYHPDQVEDFEVIDGELTVRIDSEIIVLKQGDTIHIPPNKIHSMWNNSQQKAIVNWKVRPALDTEYFLETVTGLAMDGKTDADGRPGILQVALLANKYTNVFRLAHPPFIIQKILFTILTPFAYLAGFRSGYKKYFD